MPWTYNCPMNPVFCGLVLALVALVAHAGEIYRCEHGGQLTYSDRPCAPAARPAPLPPLQTVPAGPAQRGLADAWDRQTERARRARDRADSAWLKAYRDKKASEQAVRKGLIEERVVVGMTPDQVQQVLHQLPDRVSGDPGQPNRWVFYNGRARRTTVWFKRGRVSKIVYRGPRDE